VVLAVDNGSGEEEKTEGDRIQPAVYNMTELLQNIGSLLADKEKPVPIDQLMEITR
jgi:hypothetical protein